MHLVIRCKLYTLLVQSGESALAPAVGRETHDIGTVGLGGGIVTGNGRLAEVALLEVNALSHLLLHLQGHRRAPRCVEVCLGLRVAGARAKVIDAAAAPI